MSKNLLQMKAQQTRKIRELQDALTAAGFRTVEEQSRALSVCRSTAWTIRRAIHKGSGLSATIISRMLAAPKLPPTVRDKILDYVYEKVNGEYGHSPAQCRRFIARISSGLLPDHIGCRTAREPEDCRQKRVDERIKEGAGTRRRS